MGTKTLALKVSFSDDDAKLAYQMLKKIGLDTTETLDNMCEGEPVDINMSEMSTDNAYEICMALMAARVATKLQV